VQPDRARRRAPALRPKRARVEERPVVTVTHVAEDVPRVRAKAIEIIRRLLAEPDRR
jgi:hypothetical protein